jgi:EAL domain-containing protein (putative c-di-GMP-specific phosphodiesterase class I)
VLEETGLAASSLKLEITESVMMEDYDTALKMLTELRELGVELSMDDFGTGYSSLSYLHRFPVGTLKIDRTFIDGMGKQGESGEIVRTIITLAQNLGIKVVAEGVETRWQHERLKALGCGYGQGYLYSRAMRVEQVEGMLARQADAGTIK